MAWGHGHTAYIVSARHGLVGLCAVETRGALVPNGVGNGHAELQVYMCAGVMVRRQEVESNGQ
jgi:hypothetical protein